MSVEGSTHFIPRVNTIKAVEVAAIVAPIAIYTARKLTHEQQKTTIEKQRSIEKQRKIDQERLETLRSNVNSGDFFLPAKYSEEYNS